MDNNPKTTDDWSWGQIIKCVLLPKPKNAPKAGKKEKMVRGGLVACGGLVALIALSTGSNELPDCASADAKNLVMRITSDLPLIRNSGVEILDVKDIEEQGYSESKEIRSCIATLVSSAGEDDVQYSVMWQDKENAQFAVEARIL